MPGKPPPLSLLRSSLPSARFSHMSFNPAHHSSRPAPIFSRVFSFKLKYLGLQCSPSQTRQQQPLPRSFSTRPFRSTKPESISKYPRRDGELRSATKSLIEDEAELSDWVSELRAGSHRAGAATEDEEEADWGKGKGKKGRRDNDRNRNMRGELGNFGRDGKGMKRGRDTGFSDIGDKRGFRDSSNFGSNNLRSRGRFNSESDDVDDDDEDDDDDRWNSKMKKGSGVREVMKRGRREFEMRQWGDKGGGREFESRKWGNRGGGREFESRKWGNRGGGRVGRGENGGGRQAAKLMSEDDESDGLDGREKSVSSFMDLIGEEDSEEGSDVGDDDVDEVEIKSRSSLFGQELRKESSLHTSPSKGDSYLTETRFDQCAISPLSLKAIKDAGYEKMTVVQEATLPVILQGKDVLAKAKTGTGKTVAFLLPSIEVVVNSPPVTRDQKRPPIFVLVICPTRELATQAAAEANTLLKHHPSVGVQVVMGGTRLAVEQKRMQANPCQILVATPGRFRDHLENTSGFATRLMGVKVLVLDEADHLLDMGFRKDIERIIAAVPKQRQTLLFSATIPEEVRKICLIALKRDHDFINTIREGSEDTHSQVRQMHLVAPLDKHFPLLYVILKEHISDDVNYKVLVFCTTAMVTKLIADLLGELNLNVREIHSRKPQSYRTRVSDEFRKSKGLILVTSDVSARGVDYPDVTLVMQLGLPSDREQYIHRLGRTGRKGKEGQGILLLAPWEEYFLSFIKDLPITKAQMPMIDPDVKKKVERALSNVEMKNKESAYQAWLGYYNSNKIVGRDKCKLVELANEFSRCMGLDNPPAIPKLVIGKMGLRNIPGLRSK
ncbi:hypothetical protein Ancab_036795 [Ancistrocladus abbreviatus]